VRLPRALITGYGVPHLVQRGRIETIRWLCTSTDDDRTIVDPATGHTRLVVSPRVVCTVGPTYNVHRTIIEEPPLWNRVDIDSFGDLPLDRSILRGHQIVDFLANAAATVSTFG
jgi:hypothetical protein